MNAEQWFLPGPRSTARSPHKRASRPMPKMTRHNVPATLILIGLALSPALSAAETLGIFTVVESKPVSELWLNPGFYSYHFQRKKGFNDSNFGLGGEYRYSTIGSVTLGAFENSDRQTHAMPAGIGSHWDWALCVWERLPELSMDIRCGMGAGSSQSFRQPASSTNTSEQT